MRPLILALLCVSVPAVAQADTHFSLGAGGTLRWNDVTPGLWTGAELWPAGLWGVRADGYFFQGGDVFLEASIARQLGGTRPHLAIAFHAGGGVELEHGTPTALVGTGGLSTQLGIKGPIALALDVGLHGSAWTDRFQLAFVGTLGVLAAW